MHRDLTLGVMFVIKFSCGGSSETDVLCGHLSIIPVIGIFLVGRLISLHFLLVRLLIVITAPANTEVTVTT
jgi:hypothetical protein